ncbi:MAG: SH3 domain-containing protein [Victivallales bacterium]|nr:SH3 domain-containing protein [Victivallales bacterium]
MKIKTAMIVCALAILQSGLAAAPQEGTITAHRLNIRVKPGNSTVIGSLQRGEKVLIQEVKNGWCRIAVPDKAPVWVAAKFIKDGKVLKNVNLRSGPGLRYRSYGVAKAGQPVKIIDDKNKDWLRIEPITSLSGWIAVQFVKLDQAADSPATPTEKLPPGGKEILKKIADTPTPAPADKVSPPADRKVKAPLVERPKTVMLPEENTEELEKELPFIDEPAVEDSFEGILVTLNPGSKVVSHAISVYDNGQYKPLCYLYSHRDELNKYVDQRVKITGRKRWIKSWKIPVVKVLSITPLTPAN